MDVLTLLLVAIGGFGFGYGIADRDHRKTLETLERLIDKIEKRLQES